MNFSTHNFSFKKKHVVNSWGKQESDAEKYLKTKTSTLTKQIKQSLFI